MTQEAASCCKVVLAESFTSMDLQQQSCEDHSILSLWMERRGCSMQLNVDGDVRDCRRPAGTYATYSWVLRCTGS